VRTTEETPTAPADYALLSGAYLTLLGGLAASARRRRLRRGVDEIAPAEIVPLAVATFALSKMVVHEKVETWMRAPFVEEHAEGRRPKGRRMRYAMGELLTCTRCTGAWGALGLVGLRLHAPRAGRVVTAVLATSGGNDFAHSAFSLLCGTATRADHEAQATSPEARGDGAGHPQDDGAGHPQGARPRAA
jgi:hypothetical protein